MNLEAIVHLDDLRAHDPQIVRDGGDAIGFLHPQFLGVANDRGAAGERAGHRQNRQFVDQLRNFFSLDDGAFERRAGDFDDAARLELIDIFDGFAHLRAHAHEHAEQCRARIVQADVAHEQMTARLRGGRDQPKRRGRNVARNNEIARLRHLIAKNADAADPSSCVRTRK